MGCNRPDFCSGWHANTHRHAHTQTHHSWPTQREYLHYYLETRLPLHHHDGCHNVQSLENGVTHSIFILSSSRQHSTAKEQKKLKLNCALCACCKILGWYTHSHRRTVHVCHTGKTLQVRLLLYRCCVKVHLV